MDDLTSCLSKIVHLCIESSIFLNQLYKFDYQLSKFYSLRHVSSIKVFSILERFTIINNDFNLYYKNYFFKIYAETSCYLSRKHFTLNCSSEIIHNIHNDLYHLNCYLNQENNYYEDIFHCIHKLGIICSLFVQYFQSCTNAELTNRLVYIRYDLLIYLKKLNEKIKSLLTQINANFERRKRLTAHNINTSHNHYSKIKMKLSDFLRTILFWLLIVFLVGYYMKWSFIYDNEPRISWSM